MSISLFLLFNIDILFKWLGFRVGFGKRRWFIETEEVMES